MLTKREAARRLRRSVEWVRGALAGMTAEYDRVGNAHLITQATYERLEALSDKNRAARRKARDKATSAA